MPIQAQYKQPKVLLTPFWLIATTFIGIADASYLAYYHLLGITPGCLLKGCEVVLQSPYAKVFDVPLSYLGLVFYVYMFLLAVLLAIDPTSRGLRIGLLLYSVVGVLSSLIFIFLQLFVIHAICQYCMLSALTTFTLFGLAVWHWRASKA
ncbi:MAG TPA: vitamin K epoxide reductase family protein [Candidatus Paceibacterota bacterium]